MLVPFLHLKKNPEFYLVCIRKAKYMYQYQILKKKNVYRQQPVRIFLMRILRVYQLLVQSRIDIGKQMFCTIK